jgi:CPA1 family monovalent cation:H+ antiporter
MQLFNGDFERSILFCLGRVCAGLFHLLPHLHCLLYANNGSLIAQRNTVLFLSFVVIIFTLVIQGISLPQLIKRITPKPNKQDKGKELNDLLIERSLSYLESLKSTDH